jgi:ATP adenylyltransferase
MEYITGAKDSHKDKCFLCVDATADDASLVLTRKPTAFLIMNKYPYANGHVMAVPVRHVSNLQYLTDQEIVDMMALVRLVSAILQQELSAEGLNIGINVGKAAGAGLEDHVHIHVVPRWFGDTNFMPVIGETKVISEHLRETYQKLKNSIVGKGT